MQNATDELEILKKMLDTLPNSIYLKDAEGRYIWINKSAIKQLELKHSITQSIIGKTDFDVFPEPNAAEYARNDKKVIETGQGICTEEEVVLLNKQKLTQLSFKEPLYNGNPPALIGVLGYTIDITEIKKKEEELCKEKEKSEAANKTKAEFLENMRHDIRTPLMGIVGFADLIKNEAVDLKIKDYADNLIASSYALLDLLNGVLGAIKASSGEIPLLKKKFNLESKLKEVILLNQAKAHQKNLALLFECDANIPNYLMGDPTRIHRIVLELITNALNFTDKGHVRLSAQLAKNNENNVIVKIIVEDTGIGIKPEDQEEIYVQFKRLSPSYQGKYKGFGLGLFIAKQFVEDLQGELYLESQLGFGAKFIFIVKLEKSLLDEALGSDNTLSLSDNIYLDPQCIAPATKPCILVVEDNMAAASFLISMLSGLNCNAELAERGELAVQLAKEKHYDLILMDIGLPDIDGYETTRRIRLDSKKYSPIIALTAHLDEDNKKYCIDVGMDGALSKPLTREKAQEILSFFLHQKHALGSEELGRSKKTLDIEKEIIDFKFLENQYGKEKVTQMLAILLDSLPNERNQLQAAYIEKDWLSIQKLTHRLKGGVGYCGALRLQEACFNLESSIKVGEDAVWDDFYNELLSEIATTQEFIESKLQA